MLALAELHEASGRPSLAMEALAATPGGGVGDVPLPLLQRRAELLLRLGRPVRILSSLLTWVDMHFCVSPSVLAHTYP